MTYNTHLISPGMRCLPDFLEQSEMETALFSILLGGSLDAGDIAAKFNVTPDEAAAIIECIVHADDIAPDEAKIIAAGILKANPDMVALMKYSTTKPNRFWSTNCREFIRIISKKQAATSSMQKIPVGGC
jgi:hypothetical protein